MRGCVLAVILLASSIAFGQAAAEGAMLNSGVSAGATKGGTGLGGALNQSFGRVSGKMSSPAQSQTIEVPAARAKRRASTQRVSTQGAHPKQKQVPQAGKATAPAGTHKMTATVFPASAVYTPKKPAPKPAKPMPEGDQNH